MIEVRDFRGKLNFDDNDYRVPKGDYTDALNITRDAQGEGQDMVVSTIPGNLIVEDELPTGTSKVIGNFADKTRNRFYYCTWNSDGFNRISYYDLNTETIVVLIEDLTDTGGVPVLNFDPSWRINHIDIIYRDEEGDLFFWTDGLNPPSKINVKTAENGDYGTIIRSYLDVAKEPPTAPPYCAYEDVAGSSSVPKVNNVVSKQFKFKYRFVFDDSEKSVTSSQSEVPIPYNYTDQASISNPLNNGCIRLLLQTGAANVTRIEILGCESNGVAFGDFFIVDILDKSILSIPNNDVIPYLFFNDKTFSVIPLTESLQPFDNVPQTAYTQSLLNGNVLDYGAITEGYDLIEINSTVTPSSLRSDRSYNFLLIKAYQQAQPAYGQGNIKILLGGIPLTGDSFKIYISSEPYDFTTQSNITITVSSGDTINDVANNISTAAAGLGYTVVSTTSNEVVIFKAGYSLIGVVISAGVSLATTNSTLAYDWLSKYEFGIIYFDEKGRTPGVNPIKNPLATTPFWNRIIFPTVVPVLLPAFNVIINGSIKPPNWAYYYQWVRSENLSKSNFLYWISDATYKQLQTDIQGYQYAYISITNLYLYVANNPQFSSVLGYEFTEGDRIKFVTRVINGVDDPIGYKSDNDFPILAVEVDPKINGITKVGNYIKIFLPSNLNTDFDFGENQAYSNYFIEIYTPAKNFASTSTIFYEFGEKYTIGNPGTNNAYHQGKLFTGIPIGAFNQGSYTFPGTPPITFNTAAIFSFLQGDSYYRNRYIQSGGSATFVMKSVTGITGSSYPMIADLGTNEIPSLYWKGQSVNGTTTTNPIVSLGQQVSANIFPHTFNYIFSGVITIKNTNAITGAGPIFLEFSSTSFGTVDASFALGTLTAGQTKALTIGNITSSTLTVTPTNYGWRIRNAGVNAIDLIEFTLTVTDSNSCKIGVIDKNFSDNYASSASVNGRPWVYNPNIKREFNPALVRFGGEYQPGTNVNNINRFFDEDLDVYDRSRGSIKKMFIEGRNQYIFQEFDVGVVTVLTQIVRDTAGNPLSAESNRLLNKIVYPYIGQYGIGNVPESFAYGKRAKYFVDNNKGVVCRLSADGITPLSILYKANSFFVSKTAGFNDNLNATNLANSTPTIYGAFDAYTNKYIIAMSEINRLDFYQEPCTLSFLESRDSTEGFECFLSFHPENMGAINNLFVTFLDGNIWTHNNPTYCNFYDNQYGSSISAVFNDNALDKKTYLAIMQTGNTIWYCPSIISQLNSYGSTPQETSLNAARFKLLEGQYNSAILRDAYSIGGIINGDTMKGNFLTIKFQIDSASDFYYINTVSLKYINSPLNTR